MLKAIVQSHEQLSNFLSAFSQVFKNRPQYRHFQAYVLGLIIYLGSRNLAGLSRAIPDGKSACSLYRFVAKMDWDTEQVEQIRWEMLNRRTRRALHAIGRQVSFYSTFRARISPPQRAPTPKLPAADAPAGSYSAGPN